MLNILRGVCAFHSETGTEGGYWAFQDGRFIYPPSPEFPHGQWSYDGLHILKDGDQLTIYDKENPTQVVWKGTISLITYPVFTEDAYGLWIHHDQHGVDRRTWALWFLREYPASFIPASGN